MTNPLLAKINSMPGQTFRLPSKGTVYTNGELAPDVVNGEVIIYPMSTLDEIYIKTPEMLFQGSAVEKIIEHRVPQILKPKEILAKDIDYILTCLRKVSYGDNFTITYKCTCENAKSHDYMIDLNNILKKVKEIDNDDLLSANIEGFEFKFKYSRYKDMVNLMQNQIGTTSTPEELYEMLISALISNIESIDEIEDVSVIGEFLKNTNVSFQNKLVEHISKINNWGMEFTESITCKDCGKSTNITIPLNPVNFFSQPSIQKTEN